MEDKSEITDGGAQSQIKLGSDFSVYIDTYTTGIGWLVYSVI